MGEGVPFVDLGHLHQPLRDELLLELSSIIDSGAFVNGPAVGRFEDAFAAFCGRTHGVGTASGLDALRLALLAAGLQPGDEVIAPAQTFIATIEAITQAGGRPVLADVGEGDYNVDVAAVERAITSRTRFVMPVHLYGQLADMPALAELTEAHGLQMIEDGAQAHGARRDGLRAGERGLVGAFSFYPTKNLGALGDAGACVLDDELLATRLRALREHGQTRKDQHDEVGYTSRLDTFQAAALLHKLPRLDGWNAQRRAAAARYEDGLAGIGDLRLPPVPAGSEPVWHLYVVRTRDRERLAAFLADRGIRTGRHYPVPVHLTPAYAHLGHGRGDFPVAEALAREGLSLPIYPGISGAQLEQVIAAVRAFFSAGRAAS